MLRENHLFRRLYHRGKSYVRPCFVVYLLRAGKRKKNRLGITATKKVGGAVSRNRARRVILEAYRLSEDKIPGGLDIVIVARTRAATVKMQVVRADLLALFEKIKGTSL